MHGPKKLISVVIPCFNEEENIENTYKVVKEIVSKIPKYAFEIVFVDNGSEDRSAELMKKLAEQKEGVVAVLLSRNFGPESSGLAGLTQAKGDAVVLMAADLQDPPELIPEFIEKWEEGFDMVLGQVKSTHDGKVMLAIRRGFYRFLRRTSYIDIPLNVTGFGLIDRKVNDAIVAMPERSRFYRGLLALAGFKQAYVQFVRPERQFGKTSYNFMGYIKHAEKGLFSFTTVPLDTITFLGVILVGLSVLAIIVYLFWVFVFGNPITGSITLFLSIVFFGSMNLLAVSIVGKYIGIIFEEAKNRPHFIVREVVEKE